MTMPLMWRRLQSTDKTGRGVTVEEGETDKLAGHIQGHVATGASLHVSSLCDTPVYCQRHRG